MSGHSQRRAKATFVPLAAVGAKLKLRLKSDVSLEDGQSMNRNMRKKTRSGKRGDKRETKA
jgi:hypothetical protein